MPELGKTSRTSVTIVMLVIFLIGGLFVIPVSAQALGGVFFASVSGSVELTIVSDVAASSVPVPATGAVATTTLAVLLAFAGVAALKRWPTAAP